MTIWHSEVIIVQVSEIINVHANYDVENRCYVIIDERWHYVWIIRDFSLWSHIEEKDDIVVQMYWLNDINRHDSYYSYIFKYDQK